MNKLVLDGSTPLILAVKSGKRKVVEKLLELGANIHAKTQPMRSTVLHQAVHNEDLPLLKLFLSKYKERFLEVRLFVSNLKLCLGTR